MPVKGYDYEYENSLGIALLLIEYEDTDVTEDQARSWERDDLIDWVNLWSEDA